jgi:ribonuclease D
MILPTEPTYPIDYVDSVTGMDRLLKAMDAVDTVFLDLEADSMHHYYAKICLIQILVGERCYLVDPLSDIILDGFLKKLAGKVLVLHGADYDYACSTRHPVSVRTRYTTPCSRRNCWANPPLGWPRW